jgi:hypothetical protein
MGDRLHFSILDENFIKASSLLVNSAKEDNSTSHSRYQEDFPFRADFSSACKHMGNLVK